MTEMAEVRTWADVQPGDRVMRTTRISVVADVSRESTGRADYTFIVYDDGTSADRRNDTLVAVVISCEHDREDEGEDHERYQHD